MYLYTYISDNCKLNTHVYYIAREGDGKRVWNSKKKAVWQINYFITPC